MKMTTKFVLFGAAAMLFSGCSQFCTSIEGNWEMEGTPADIEATIMLMPGGEIAGSTGLNNYFGQYSLPAENGILLEPQGMTRRAGSPVEMEFENDFMEILRKANKYSIDGERLILKENDNIIAVFEKED